MRLPAHLPKLFSPRLLFSLLACWTLLVSASAVWNMFINQQDMKDRALVEARTILQHNLAYRRWNSLYGGVYAQVSHFNQPNPYIVVENRDVYTLDGKQLTVINPFQMTKQAYDLLQKQSPSLAALNRTVSLDPLNPDNSPDEWERLALLAFEEGVEEVSEITELEGESYLRLLAPYVTERRCLKCHAHQGYSIGDIRGGMSIAVPMEPYYQAAIGSRRTILGTHLILWLLGTGALFLFFSWLQRSKEDTAESERKFRIISEFAYNFECWIDENQKILFVAPSAERITGYASDEFLTKQTLLFDIIHPDDRELVMNHFNKSEFNNSLDMQYRIVTKDGRVRWMAHTCTPIMLEGKYLGRRGSSRDITEQKEMEGQLLQAQKMECLGHFAGGVGHDFNNVLSSITTFVHLVQDELPEKDAFSHECIDRIIIAAKLGKNMISNLLSFGQKQMTRPERIRLSTVVDELAAILQTLINNEITCTISPARDEFFVFADPHRVEQVLINLCINARDAMAGSGELTIITKKKILEQPYAAKQGEIPAGRYMMLSVADTGTGICSSALPRIFEPFFSTKDSCKGTGLGLAIVGNIVREHRAYLEVLSELDQGTTFRIFFPAVEEEGGGARD